MTPKDQVYWYTLRQMQPQALAGDIKVDLAIVGGGMAGLMCAQAAHNQGLSVAIIEAEFCGAGASGKSSGFITPDSELELSDLIANYGPKQAKELWEFVLSGCEAIRDNIIHSKLNCDYQIQDSLFVANSPRGQFKVRQEHEARQQLGYESKFYQTDLVPHLLGSHDYYNAVRYPGTFGIIAYLYCQELKEMLIKQGVQVYERTRVTGIKDHSLITTKGMVTAQHVAFCADRFLPWLGIVPKDVYSAQTFLGLSRPLSEAEQHRIFPDQQLMVWDTDLIYQYFRLTGEGRLLLGGASVLYTYVNKEVHSPRLIFKKLQNYLRDKFPDINIELEYLWPGLIGISKDFLPVAGKHHHLPDVYYVGAAAGLPWAAALGRELAKTIVTGQASKFDKYFNTPRIYPVGYHWQKVLGKPITFAVSHAFTKYFK